VDYGDFDNDGNLDLCWTYVGTNAPQSALFFWIAFGDGQDGFLPEMSVDLGNGTCQGFPYFGYGFLDVDDYDQDGHDDILNYFVTSCTSGGPTWGIRIQYGTPTRGMFVPGPAIWPSTPTWGIQMPRALHGDWDKDGIDDFMVYQTWLTAIPTAPWEVRFHLVRGLSNRAYSATAMTYALPQPAPSLWPLPADFDGDGDLDIIGTPSGTTEFYTNRAVDRPGCAGTGGLIPSLAIDPPAIGNLGFGINLAQALPSSPALLALSLGRVGNSPPCAPGIDLSASNLVLPLESLLVTTDAMGNARIPLPIPSLPSLLGATVYAQWAVFDPAGGSVAPLNSLAFSRSRKIILWQ
jgi:hypothetical protein